MTQAGWIYWGDSEPCGPVSTEDLIDLVRLGRIDATTDVRKEADVAWSAAGIALPELFVAPNTAGGGAHAKAAWNDIRPHPWRRYFARMTDNLIVGGVIWALIGIVVYSIAPAQAAQFFAIFKLPGGNLLDAILTILAAIPGNALMIGLTGLSIGKWIFGIRVLKDGAPIGVSTAFKREFMIWLRGLGCGIPLISLFTLVGSFNQLLEARKAPWDKDLEATVVHRNESALATVLMWVAGICIVLVAAALRLNGQR